jgi:hypothetical protein
MPMGCSESVYTCVLRVQKGPESMEILLVWNAIKKGQWK